MLAGRCPHRLARVVQRAGRCDIRSERVQFKKGVEQRRRRGQDQGLPDGGLRGRRATGQSANISLATKHGATYFNILAPGQNEVAFFNGSTSQNQYEGVLPATGDYRIRVYMMRAAARRNEVADYRLEVAIGAGPAATAAPAADAKVGDTGFHATGNVPCAMGGGAPTGSCPYGVTRQGQGTGMVTVTRPDGRKRVIFLDKGRATRYDQSQADKGAFKVTRQSDLSIVHVGDERYEIPDAVISGG